MAIVTPGCEIHFGKIASGAQNLVNQAHAFKKNLPIKIGGQPHAGDHVAAGDGDGCWSLMLGADDFIRRGAWRSQPFVEPNENGTDFGIEISQSLNELNGESPFKRLLFKVSKNAGRGNRGLATCSQQTIG